MLKNKRALIIGVANKYSLAWNIAEKFIKEGATVYLTYKNERFLNNINHLISNHSKTTKPFIYQCDITDENQIKLLFKEYENNNNNNNNNKLDILVHSIAYAPSHCLQSSFIENTSLNDYIKTHEISSYSLLLLAKYALPYMKDTTTNSSSIISLSYIGSSKIVPNYNIMGTAKASLESIMRQLAYDLGKYKIRVNCLSPGPINTISARGIPGISKMIQKTADISPLRRNITSKEIADVATFLASDLSTCITGQTIYADCGMNILYPN